MLGGDVSRHAVQVEEHAGAEQAGVEGLPVRVGLHVEEQSLPGGEGRVAVGADQGLLGRLGAVADHHHGPEAVVVGSLGGGQAAFEGNGFASLRVSDFPVCWLSLRQWRFFRGVFLVVIDSYGTLARFFNFATFP